MSLCPGCREAEKPPGRSYCVDCQRRAGRASDAKGRKLVGDFIRALKEGKPCTDCKAMLPHYVLEFDHRDPKEKKFNISSMVNSHRHQAKWPEILAEVAKCDVVCRNCHKIRGVTRGDLGRRRSD